MANIIPFNFGQKSEVPAHLAALFGEDANIAPRHTTNQLSYKGSKWRLQVNGDEKLLEREDKESGDRVPVQVITLVVLDHNKARSRAYYEGAWEDGKNKAPKCASMDGVKPDANIKEPCAATCASCPNSVKGSLINENGKAVTACQPNKRIAVAPSGLLGKHPALLLKIAQTSVWDKDNPYESQGWYAWDQYLDMLRTHDVKHTAAVETKVKFDPRPSYPKLLFSASRWLNPEEAALAKAMLKDNAEEISKIINGSPATDGVTGNPGVPPQGIESTTLPTGDEAGEDNSAAETAQAAAVAEAAAATAAAAAAAKKAKAKADKKAAAEAAAKAAAAAAEAAAKAAAEDEDEEEDSGNAFAAAAEAPAAAAPARAATAAAAATPVEAAATVGTPAALADLMNGWDDAE